MLFDGFYRLIRCNYRYLAVIMVITEYIALFDRIYSLKWCIYRYLAVLMIKNAQNSVINAILLYLTVKFCVLTLCSCNEFKNA